MISLEKIPSFIIHNGITASEIIMNPLPLYLSALTLEEKLSLSGEMLLRGLGTVFMALIILWGIISLFKVFTVSEKKAPNNEMLPKEAEKTTKRNVNISVETLQNSASANEDEIVAAIIAAIEAYRTSEGLSGLPYRVVSFKKRSGRKSRGGDDR